MLSDNTSKTEMPFPCSSTTKAVYRGNFHQVGVKSCSEADNTSVGILECSSSHDICHKTHDRGLRCLVRLTVTGRLCCPLLGIDEYATVLSLLTFSCPGVDSLALCWCCHKALRHCMTLVFRTIAAMDDALDKV